MIVSLVLALVLIPTALVIASDIFSDVPVGHIFHNDINAIYGARITTGRTPTTYVPEDPVLRGEMAAFLHRGLGRVAYDTRDPVFLSNSEQDIAVLTINTGGASGGTGFLKVDASFTASTFNITTACPCTIFFYLLADDAANTLPHVFTLYDPVGVGDRNIASGAVTLAFPVPTGNLTQTVRLRAHIYTSEAPVAPNSIVAWGNITALWVPFGATGGNTLNAASASPDDAPQGTEPDEKPDTER